MARTIACICIMLACVAAASKKETAPEWPQKGDTVYVSVTLTHEIPSIFSRMDSEVPACVPLSVRLSAPESEKWKVRAPGAAWSMNMTLRGPWLPRMHHTEDACDKAKVDEPKVVRRGSIHTIIPPAEKHETP